MRPSTFILGWLQGLSLVFGWSSSSCDFVHVLGLQEAEQCHHAPGHDCRKDWRCSFVVGESKTGESRTVYAFELCIAVVVPSSLDTTAWCCDVDRFYNIFTYRVS